MPCAITLPPGVHCCAVSSSADDNNHTALPGPRANASLDGRQCFGNGTGNPSPPTSRHSGYRVNPRRAVRVRQWAPRVPREHLVRGWTLNRDRLEANARELEAAMALARKVASVRNWTPIRGGSSGYR